MSTKPDPQDFSDIRRLLALKRHEQPPPGYFSHFSREVILRIRAGERASDHFYESWLVTAWLQRFWSAMENRPALAGAFGACLCAAMLWAFVSTENAGTTSAVIAGEPLGGQKSLPRVFPANQLGDGMLVGFSSTNGVVAQPHSALFDGGWPRPDLGRFP